MEASLDAPYGPAELEALGRAALMPPSAATNQTAPVSWDLTTLPDVLVAHLAPVPWQIAAPMLGLPLRWTADVASALQDDDLNAWQCAALVLYSGDSQLGAAGHYSLAEFSQQHGSTELGPPGLYEPLKGYLTGSAAAERMQHCCVVAAVLARRPAICNFGVVALSLLTTLECVGRTAGSSRTTKRPSTTSNIGPTQRGTRRKQVTGGRFPHGGTGSKPSTDNLPYGLITLFDGTSRSKYTFGELCQHKPAAVIAAELDSQVRVVAADIHGWSLDSSEWKQD